MSECILDMIPQRDRMAHAYWTARICLVRDEGFWLTPLFYEEVHEYPYGGKNLGHVRFTLPSWWSMC